MRASGDGWTTCAAGHRHWGRYGAAGLLLRSAPVDGAVALQLRVGWSHHGDTWGVLGGAADAGETAVQTALREAAEEATVEPDRVRVEAAYRDDHGGWAYTTVVATASAPFALAARGEESVTVRWVEADRVDALPLHPGFAGSWPVLRDVGPAPLVVVDAANVIGSRPDGWWRDRAGAVRRLRDQLAEAAATGVAAAGLAGPAPAALTSYPRYLLVAEGAARGVGSVPGLEVVDAPGSGDDAVVAAVAARGGGPRPVLVVTADRGLRERVQALGAATVGPRTLLDLLEPRPPGRGTAPAP